MDRTTHNKRNDRGTPDFSTMDFLLAESLGANALPQLPRLRALGLYGVWAGRYAVEGIDSKNHPGGGWPIPAQSHLQ